MELNIALFVKDRFIRPFGGDVLVVLLIYSFLKIFWDGSIVKIAFIVLVFSFVIEILQYFDFVKFLGLQDYKIAVIVLRSTFNWLDLIAYIIGFFIIIVVEKWINRGNNKTSITDLHRP